MRVESRVVRSPRGRRAPEGPRSLLRSRSCLDTGGPRAGGGAGAVCAVRLRRARELRAAGLQHEDSEWVRRAGVTGRQAAEGDEDDACAERDGYDHIFVV